MVLWPARKAYCYSKILFLQNDKILWFNIWSKTLDRMGNIDKGRISPEQCIVEVFGIETTRAVFHAVGKTDVVLVELKKSKTK